MMNLFAGKVALNDAEIFGKLVARRLLYLCSLHAGFTTGIALPLDDRVSA
jgi:hypothetical protein